MKTTTIAARAAIVAATAAAAFTAPTLAQVNYVESVDGDLSNDGFATTDLGTFGLGINSVSGTMGTSFDFDPDYFTFTIAAGQSLQAINFVQYDPGFGGTQASFIAMQAGNQVTSSFDLSVFLGATLIGDMPGNMVGDDILDDIVVTPLYGGQLASTPLAAGTYSIWWQETGDVVDYAFEFVVVPAPSAMTALLGAGLIATRRRRA